MEDNAKHFHSEKLDDMSKTDAMNTGTDHQCPAR